MLRAAATFEREYARLKGPRGVTPWSYRNRAKVGTETAARNSRCGLAFALTHNAWKCRIMLDLSHGRRLCFLGTKGSCVLR